MKINPVTPARCPCARPFSTLYSTSGGKPKYTAHRPTGNFLIKGSSRGSGLQSASGGTTTVNQVGYIASLARA